MLARISGWRLWPASLATRTALVLLGGLLLSQVGGLMLHALDRAEMLYTTREHELSHQVMATYRTLALAPPEQRASLVDQARRPGAVTPALSDHAPSFGMPPAPALIQRHLLSHSREIPLPQSLLPRAILVHSNEDQSRIAIGLQLPEGQWLTAEMVVRPSWTWYSNAFLVTFIAMSVVAALLTLWSVRRLVEPVATLAGAAETLGRDVNAPPLPETGPQEVAAAAAAFNTMAARIRRFVEDRTFLLTAIGHDLRTPLTRLRLRAEFMEDEDQRRRMLADLDELEAMVSATLAFGRDATTSEPAVPLDLAALIVTVISEAGDARPGLAANALSYCGPDHLAVVARPIALKRALTNLVSNALDYAGNARVQLLPPQDGLLTVLVDDDGPGIPPAELERMFLPFQRLEPSRNRETGGMGLGLSIARNIMRAQGGDVALANRSGGGLRATITLPA